MREREAARIVAGARALVGARFRLHGRDPAHGLDCIGVVLCAHAGAGIRLAAPDDYPLRGWPRTYVDDWIARSGLVEVAGPVRAGDVTLIAAGFGQWHFGIVGEGVLIHADARQRRVVVTPWTGAQASNWRARRIIDEGDRPWLRWS